ncbi:MAG TPA: OPT/YSL family transporter, partial [Solirubrobacteraceae bacterium]|nr:OPT/YSL family transporter [Solirubrobacteraceae bacterium]
IPVFDWLATSGADTQAAHWLGVVPGTLDPDALWSHYVRFVGAGGVAFGGFLSLAKALPSIVRSFGAGVKGFGRGGEGDARERTDRDLPLPFVLVGVSAITLALWLAPPFELGPLEAVLALVFSFFFVVVASRMVGMIGTTSQPISGMTIAALLCSSFIIAHVRGSSSATMFAAMTVGVIVCVAISLSGDLSQDLKTCTLVGGTPWVVQSGQMVGTLSAALRAGFVLLLLDARYHLGSPALPAPQATLMATLVQGAFGGHLPWALLAVGAVLALGAELLGWGGLAFSIGLYLPVATSATFIFGGILAWALRKKHPGESHGPADEKATLLSSGLIAGYALMGIAVAFIGVAADQATEHPGLRLFAWISAHATLRTAFNLGPLEDVITIVPFGLLVWLLWHTANRAEIPE